MRSGGPHAGQPPPAKIHENMQSPQAATVPIFRVLMRFWLPIRPGGLPYAGAVSHALWHFPYVFAASHAIPRPPIHRPSPHTVSRFPHTATRLMHFPIRFGRSPQSGHLPIRFPRIHHTIRKLQGIRPQIRRDQRPAPQIHAPAKSRKSYGPATGGGAGISCMCAYACTAMGISARTRAPSRPWSYLHGHAHACTVMRIPARPWRASPPAETSDQFHKLHINTVTQIPCGCVQPVVVTSRRSGNSWGRLARGFWSSGKGVGAEFGSHIFIFVSNRAPCSQNYFQRYQ